MSSNLQEPTQTASKQSHRLKWTTEMNNTLLDCKAKAQALWMINCILYAVVVAFLFYKKWKKPAETKGQKERKIQSQKMKDA